MNTGLNQVLESRGRRECEPTAAQWRALALCALMLAILLLGILIGRASVPVRL